MKFSKEQANLFKKNKKFLVKRYPGISGIIDTNIPANVDLYDGDDEIDLLINGVRYYGVDARLYADRHLESFIASPGVAESSLPGATTELTPTHVRFLKKYDESLRRANISVSLNRARSESASLVFFGIGLGFHFEKFLNIINCRKLILIEPEPLFFIMSLYFIDWKELLVKRKLEVVFIFEKNPETAFSMMRNNMHYFNVGIQQVIYHSKHYSSEYTDNLVRHFNNNWNYIFDGLGYYDDEKRMLNNHLLNSYCDVWRLCDQRKQSLIYPAVIIGAGPSLNRDIPWLIENQGKVVIFSGGSALPTLLKNGIIPDFHVEIENISLNFDLLAPLVEKYNLKETVLICSSTMDPAAARLFPRRMWYMREGVMASHIFDVGQTTLIWQNPTVVNTATAAACALGFRDVMLLGADFGTRDPKVHHSADSFYDYHDELKTVEFKFPETTKANFGGKAFTNTHYLNGIKYLKILKSHFRVVQFSNLSDGAEIPGFFAKPSSRVKIDALINDKHALITKLYDQSGVMDWLQAYGPSVIDDLEDNFINFIGEIQKTSMPVAYKQKDFIKFLSSIYVELGALSEKSKLLAPMINGSVNTYTIIMMYWWGRVLEADRLKYEKICRRQWRVFFKTLEEDFKKFLEQVRQELPLVRPELFDDKGSLIVEAKPSVQNAE